MGQNERAGGKILKNIKRVDQIGPCRGNFFLKMNKCSGQIPLHVQDKINVQGRIFFSKSINVQNKIRPCRGEFFLNIDKRACNLFGTL